MRHGLLLVLLAVGAVGCYTQTPQNKENKTNAPKYNVDPAKQKTLLHGKR
ncbi:hypothetical protein [Helicobacter cynogastricus]|nr:hypothetical protein [Helicobacter cynogastricus]